MWCGVMLCISAVYAYLENGIFDLLRLTRFDQIRRFAADILELRLVRRNALLQLRDIVFRVLIPSVKEVAHADERISLPFKIFQHAFFPAPRFVVEELARLVEMARCGGEALVEQRHVVCVDGVCVLRGFGEAGERGGEAEVFYGHAFVTAG